MNCLRRFHAKPRINPFISIALLGLSWAAGPLAAQDIPCGSTYAVVRGDTLGQISSRAYGPGNLDNFYALNASVIGPNPNLIEIGMVFQVPCTLGETVAAAAPSEPETAPVEPVQDVTSDTETVDGFEEIVVTTVTEDMPDIPDGTEVVLVFNKASGPKFVINVDIVDVYLNQITEVTEGRVRFTDPAEMNRDARAQLALVTSGAVDGAYVYNGYLTDSHPLLQLSMQPLMGGTAEQTAVAMWRVHEQYLSQTDYFDDAQLLGFVGAPAAHIWRLREAPVVPGEDVVNSNEYTVPYFDGLDTRGAAAVREENAEWLADYDEERGNPLTFAMAHGAARAGGIWNDNRTVTEIDNGVYTPTFSVILSNQAWARISPQDQAAIMDISGEALSFRSAAWDEFDNGHRRAMIEQGLDVVKADVELLAELQDRSRVGLEAWMNAADVAGVSGFNALNFYQENLRALQKPTEF